jgi:RES domain-containing protein
MILYRCTLKKWAEDISGQGAFLYGGRWNSPGQHALYTSENNLLAALEVAVRVPLSKISKDFVMVPISLPDSNEIHLPSLKKNWNQDTTYTQAQGDRFLKERKHLVMKIPSALMLGTFNYIINPRHESIRHVKALPSGPLVFDDRLIQLMNKGSEQNKK